MLDSKPEETNNTSYKALNEDLKCRVGEKRWKMIYILIWRNLVVPEGRRGSAAICSSGLGSWSRNQCPVPRRGRPDPGLLLLADTLLSPR